MIHQNNTIHKYNNQHTVKPQFTAPRFTANPDIPRPSLFLQIVLNMYNVNKQNPDLPQTPIYRGCFLSPKLHGKLGFYCTIKYFLN